MKILEALIETYPDEELLIADGFDEAILGIEENTMRVIYSVSKCLEIIEAMGMPQEDALEHFYFNVHGSYVGEKTPIFCFDDFKYSTDGDTEK
jgi:hypothetical protein